MTYSETKVSINGVTDNIQSDNVTDRKTNIEV